MTSLTAPVFSLGEKQYAIRNEKELALMIDLLASSPESYELHRHLIMSLDEELMNIILSYKGLLLCMTHMEYRNRFLLLVKIGDTLPFIIGTSEHLGSILASIPTEEDKIRIIKSIRTKGLTHMVQTPDHLGSILEWVFGEGERVIFDMLGTDFLKSLFAYGTDIYKVFHFLSPENKDIFADSLSLSFIKSRIYTAEDFFYVLKALSNDKVREFVPLFNVVELRNIIGNDDILRNYLRKITQEKEEALLHYLQS